MSNRVRYVWTLKQKQSNFERLAITIFGFEHILLQKCDIEKNCLLNFLTQFNYIQNGGTAVEAVEEAVRVLEENENFNAGCGSLLNNDREVECDAMIMEGHTLNNGRITLIIYM